VSALPPWAVLVFVLAVVVVVAALAVNAAMQMP
jgi:hypothetical protein